MPARTPVPISASEKLHSGGCKINAAFGKHTNTLFALCRGAAGHAEGAENSPGHIETATKPRTRCSVLLCVLRFAVKACVCVCVCVAS